MVKVLWLFTLIAPDMQMQVEVDTLDLCRAMEHAAEVWYGEEKIETDCRLMEEV